MIVTRPNENLASFTNGKKLTDDSKCLHPHTHGKHLKRRDNGFFPDFGFFSCNKWIPADERSTRI